MSSGPLYVQAFTESAVTGCSLWSWLSARGVLIRDPSAFSFAYSVAHGSITNLIRCLVRYRLKQTLGRWPGLIPAPWPLVRLQFPKSGLRCVVGREVATQTDHPFRRLACPSTLHLHTVCSNIRKTPNRPRHAPCRLAAITRLDCLGGAGSCAFRVFLMLFHFSLDGTQSECHRVKSGFWRDRTSPN